MVRNKKDLICFLAHKYNLTVREVERVVTYQFKFVSEIMIKGNFETVRLPYFGKFSVNKKRVKYVNELKDGARNKKSTS